ncbi:MAG: response regulator [Desulfamplus sp.]|nr:response regulator [Desulfamplus sp.]
MNVTESNIGAFYICDTEDNTIFSPIASIGSNIELLQPFDASILEGEFGQSLKTGKISHIKNIPEDTIFKFKTFAGIAVPREIITIPVVVNDDILAMVALASISGYSNAALTIFSQPSLIALNTAFGNLIANDKTRLLAEELKQTNEELESQKEELFAQTIELKAQSEEVLKQSEELQNQNIELEQQRLAVEEANRLKSQFLSNMSHELRTPLNSVMALSRVLMMQAKQKLNDEEVSYLEIIERNGKNLLNLINDILDLSKIESGRMDINPNFFSIEEAIENIVERLMPIAEEKNIEIRQNISENLPKIESDEIRVAQILQNLIANAVKFTDVGGVNISVKHDEKQIIVKIEDTGIGIAENDLSSIFDEFRQVDGSSSRRHEGTGLGLAIARKAAFMLGGKIGVTSKLGEGSIFTLTLPIKWQGAAATHAPFVSRKTNMVKSIRKTILVVDDDPDMASIISQHLLHEGYNTITATSGAEALKLAEREHPFAITLDIVMPEMDGWEVLQGLKKNPETKDIPVIIVSVSRDKETGFALGAIGYATKPVSKNSLLAEIRKIGKPDTRSIMIVDDNSFDRQAIKKIIAEDGLLPIVAEDGNACLKLIKQQIPDLLILDLVMPEVDGFAVLEKIRSNPETKNLPVIVVTAKDLTEEERKTLSGNVFSVIEKNAAKSSTLLPEIKRILCEMENPSKKQHYKKLNTLPRILLVEDNEVSIIQVRSVLESAGYIVDVAHGGQEAVKYVSHTIPDGIILDLMMPEVDGFAVLEKIRGKSDTAEIPVLILTAKDLTPEDFKRLSANHVQQLVQKGDVDRENLLMKVRLMVDNINNDDTQFDSPPSKVSVELKPTKNDKFQPETSNLEQAEKPSTILIVEDNPDNMITIKAILQNRYPILEARDGEEGLKIAAESRAKIKLILLDMAMPKMDGMTVIRHLKNNPNLRHIPTVALTAKVMKGDRENILEAGCNDYISKPIEPESFLQTITQLMEK